MIAITIRSTTAFVAFPYDEEAVQIVRTVPGRRWDPDARHWTIPASEARLAATRFTNAGFTVQIDGRPFTVSTPPPRTNGTADPIAALFHVLPVGLRQPVYKALARVLHPDLGGDTALMQSLNRANEDTR